MNIIITGNNNKVVLGGSDVKVEVYSKPDCTNCGLVKARLKMLDVDYEEKNIHGHADNWQDFKAVMERMEVPRDHWVTPVTVIDGKFVFVGYSSGVEDKIKELNEDD